MDYGTSYAKGLITLKPERKLWQKVKKFMPEISFTRLENYKDEKLYEGSRCLSLAADGLRLEACCLGLESIYEKFKRL
jgi:hypothetical protein